MNWKVLPYEDITALAYGWYNPPSAGQEQIFYSEYSDVISKLVESLNSFGSVEVDPGTIDADFILTKDTDLTRSTFIVCFNPSVFSEKIILAIHKVVEDTAQDFMVVIDGQFSHGDSFYICIERSGVKAFAKTAEKLTLFGCY